jgi:hypothetical protein
MTIQKRSLVLAAALALALAAYGVVRYHAPALIQHVVVQSLIQKAPAGVEESTVQRRLQTYLEAEPDGKTRLQKLLRLSAYLEKVQRLTHEEWDGLLTPEGAVLP